MRPGCILWLAFFIIFPKVDARGRLHEFNERSLDPLNADERDSENDDEPQEFDSQESNELKEEENEGEEDNDNDDDDDEEEEKEEKKEKKKKEEKDEEKEENRNEDDTDDREGGNEENENDEDPNDDDDDDNDDDDDTIAERSPTSHVASPVKRSIKKETTTQRTTQKKGTNIRIPKTRQRKPKSGRRSREIAKLKPKSSTNLQLPLTIQNGASSITAKPEILNTLASSHKTSRIPKEKHYKHTIVPFSQTVKIFKPSAKTQKVIMHSKSSKIVKKPCKLTTVPLPQTVTIFKPSQKTQGITGISKSSKTSAEPKKATITVPSQKITVSIDTSKPSTVSKKKPKKSTSHTKAKKPKRQTKSSETKAPASSIKSSVKASQKKKDKTKTSRSVEKSVSLFDKKPSIKYSVTTLLPIAKDKIKYGLSLGKEISLSETKHIHAKEEYVKTPLQHPSSIKYSVTHSVPTINDKAKSQHTVGKISETRPIYLKEHIKTATASSILKGNSLEIDSSVKKIEIGKIAAQHSPHILTTPMVHSVSLKTGNQNHPSIKDIYLSTSKYTIRHTSHSESTGPLEKFSKHVTSSVPTKVTSSCHKGITTVSLTSTPHLKGSTASTKPPIISKTTATLGTLLPTTKSTHAATMTTATTSKNTKVTSNKQGEGTVSQKVPLEGQATDKSSKSSDKFLYELQKTPSLKNIIQNIAG